MEIVFTKSIPDRDELFNLYNALGWNDFLKLSADSILLAMQNSYHVVCAYSGEKLVGTGRVISDGVMNAYLCGLGVLPDYRHQGIARKLTELLIKRCQEANLHMKFFCEEHLQPFYEQQGFERFAIGMRPKS